MTSTSGGRGSAPPAQHDGGRPPGSRMTVIAAVLGVVSALLAVAAGVLGYQTAMISKEKEQAQQAASTSGADVANLQKQVADLQRQNAELKSQLEGGGGPTAAPTSPTGGSVRHSGQLTMNSDGNHADLDSPSSDPQWQTGATDIYATVTFGDPNSRYALSTENNSQQLYLGKQQADYEKCRTTTGYSTESISFASLAAGDSLCWQTTEGRYSALKLLKISGNSATLDVVAYDPPRLN
jgi:hypothetical protein